MANFHCQDFAFLCSRASDHPFLQRGRPVLRRRRRRHRRQRWPTFQTFPPSSWIRTSIWWGQTCFWLGLFQTKDRSKARTRQLWDFSTSGIFFHVYVRWLLIWNVFQNDQETFEKIFPFLSSSSSSRSSSSAAAPAKEEAAVLCKQIESSGRLAQERLSHHLDDVEVSIAEQVAQKSHHFFQVRNKKVLSSSSSKSVKFQNLPRPR